MGAAYIGEIPSHDTIDTPGEPNMTAPSMFFLPGPKYMVEFHKTWLYPTNMSGASPVLLPPITLPIIPPTGLYAFHNLGHFHPVLGKGIFGGGAYNPQAEAGRYNLQFFTVSNTAAMTVTQLDNSPHVL